MDDWQSWIGRRTSTLAWLDPTQADRMNATLDREPGFRPGDPLPPAWHWLYAPDLARSGDLGEEGHPRLGLTLPPVGLPRRMWAGGTLTFHRPLLLATTIERVSIIRSVTPKTGRSGPLVFVTVEHVLREVGAGDVGGVDADDVDDGVALVEEQTVVYRDHFPPAPEPDPTAVSGPAPTPEPAAGQISGEASFSRVWSPDPVMLFRYSALTFNAHRIHYDADYCRDVEGYPGLVVHGPLLATLLLDLAAAQGRPIGRFRYTARAPLFLPGPLTVAGRPDGEATLLWAAGPDGRPVMLARVEPLTG